jgi:diguanylate cyclase (GGDEF)-like protein
MLPDIFANAPLTSEQKEILQKMQNELAQAQAQMQTLQRKIAVLEEQVVHEQAILTRPEFNREVARMLAFDERYGGRSSVLYFDIASLHHLATHRGAALAASVTRMIAQTLGQHVRRSDIIGRLATDEFGVLLARCDNENAWKKGRELAALLLTVLDVVDEQKLNLDISFGAYTFREDEDVASGIKQAAHDLTKMQKQS